jgi:hypothetical protein
MMMHPINVMIAWLGVKKMDRYSVSLSQSITAEEQKRRLAQVYALILSWSDTETETAGGDEFGDLAQLAAETPVHASTEENQAFMRREVLDIGGRDGH